MRDKQELLLAYGIAEYQSALHHLAALRRVGQQVPWSVIGRLSNQHEAMIRLWCVEHGDPVLRPHDEVVAEVRQWLTEHLTELEDLLKEEGIT